MSHEKINHVVPSQRPTLTEFLSNFSEPETAFRKKQTRVSVPEAIDTEFVRDDVEHLTAGAPFKGSIVDRLIKPSPPDGNSRKLAEIAPVKDDEVLEPQIVEGKEEIVR